MVLLLNADSKSARVTNDRHSQHSNVRITRFAQNVVSRANEAAGKVGGMLLLGSRTID
jgi:hypothetical protein